MRLSVEETRQKLDAKGKYIKILEDIVRGVLHGKEKELILNIDMKELIKKHGVDQMNIGIIEEELTKLLELGVPMFADETD